MCWKYKSINVYWIYFLMSHFKWAHIIITWGSTGIPTLSWWGESFQEVTTYLWEMEPCMPTVKSKQTGSKIISVLPFFLIMHPVVLDYKVRNKQITMVISLFCITNSCHPPRWPSRHYKRWWSCHHCAQNYSLVCALRPEVCCSLDHLVMARHCLHVPLPLNAVPRSSVLVLPAWHQNMLVRVRS